MSTTGTTAQPATTPTHSHDLPVADPERPATRADIKIAPQLREGLRLPAGQAAINRLTATPPTPGDNRYRQIAAVTCISPGSPPDIDTDFSPTIRDAVLAHVSETYGADHIARIGTVGTRAAKQAIKDVGMIYHVPFPVRNEISNQVPDNVKHLSALYDPDHEAYDEGEALRTVVEEKGFGDYIPSVLKMEGRIKAYGTHACAVAISAKPLAPAIPLRVDKKTGDVVTQWVDKECEAIGILKVDFLGLDMIGTVLHTCENIARNGLPVPNMTELAQGKFDDPKVYELLAKGDTQGVFQLGSEGVRELLPRIKPTEFADIVAATALYRPGPMGMNTHLDYADRKNDPSLVKPLHEAFVGSPLEEILEPTYQLILYQEQVSKIVQAICGFDPVEADAFRKAMGKKIPEKIASMESRFFDGALANGYPRDAVQHLWDTILPFAAYAFNKSHSVAYALNIYQALWLKVHYPAEFAAALVTKNQSDKVEKSKTLHDTRKRGLIVGGVDMNRSMPMTSALPPGSGVDIQFGMAGVDGISMDTASVLCNERTQNGPFTGVFNTIRRGVAAGVANKSVYEQLAKVGAFDQFGVSREKTVAQIPAMMKQAKAIVAAKNGPEQSLFDLLDPSGDGTDTGDGFNDDQVVDAGLKGRDRFFTRMIEEAKAQGAFLTGHPLMRAAPLLTKGGQYTSIATVLNTKSSLWTITVLGIVTAITVKSSHGDFYGTITIDDGSGQLTDIRLPGPVLNAIRKTEAQQTVRAAWEKGDATIKSTISKLVMNDAINVSQAVSLYGVYEFVFKHRAGETRNRLSLQSVTPVPITDEGVLPLRVRVPTARQAWALEKCTIAASTYPGDQEIWVGTYDAIGIPHVGNAYQHAVLQLDVPNRSTVWPPPVVVTGEAQAGRTWNDLSRSEAVAFCNQIRYTPTGLTVNPTSTVLNRMISTFGLENVDSGVVNPSIFSE